MKIRRIDTDTSEVRLTNKLKIVCDWIDTWALAVVGGRGLAKSQEIQAERTIKVIEDMPGAPLAFITDTYVNFSTNILPAIKVGWRRKGYHEGIHFICGKRPPEEWLRRCAIIVDDFKHTIFWYNGAVIFSGSLDRPSMLAGKSVVHIFSDEAKYQADAKVDRAFPILRGDATIFGHSIYFLGFTVTTDMPDVTEGEYDWVFRFAKDMNVPRMKLILDCFNQLNAWRVKLYNEINGRKRKTELEKIQKQIDKWEQRTNKARYEQTFFINASSLANIQYLTIKYFKGLIKSLGIEEFKKSVLGIRPSLKRSLRFYPNLEEKHFYSDGYNYAYYDKFGLTETIKESSRGLRYINHNEKLEAGLDIGNMKSLVIGQQSGELYRLLKFFYTLPPFSYRELGDTFTSYFKNHKTKILDLYYDRAANNYASMGEDGASKMKEVIEYTADGKRTGWHVNLMSIKQANIPMETEYEFMIAMCKEETPGLPKLRIDALNCKEVKSSMENAPAKIRYRKSLKITSKDKSSEKLPIERLPLESTNPSDAVKYLLCRKSWIQLTKAKSKTTFIPAGTV